MLNTLKKRIALSLSIMQCSMIYFAQVIPTTISLNPSIHDGFYIDKSNDLLTNIASGTNAGNEMVYSTSATTGWKTMNYHRYKFTHTGIPNSDITNVTYSFNFKTHSDQTKYPYADTYWSTSSMFIVVPPEPCNTNGGWSISTMADALSMEQCIVNGGSVLLQNISPNGQSANVTLTQSQSINNTTSPNLNGLLLNPNDFTIAFWPNANTGCDIDILSTISCQVTYNTYPIVNNILSGNQSYSGSANPTIISGTTPTGGNKGIFTYQWQSSLNNSTWTNISGATALTYDPPTITQTTYYRRIAYSAPQPASTSNIITITITPTLIPPTPTGLVATSNSATSMNLTWNSSANATSYDVYSCSGSFIANVTTTSYNHTGLTPSTTYSYKVYAKNSYGSSAATSCANGTTNSLTPPSPSGFRAISLGSSGIHFSWNPSPPQYNVQNYSIQVYNSGVLVFTKTIAASANVFSTLALGLNPSTNYQCTVFASNSYGSTGSVANVTTGATSGDASLYFNVSNTATYNSIDLSWSAQPGPCNYYIYKCDGTLLGISYTNPSYSHTGLAANTIYQYYVVAYTALGTSFRSSGQCIGTATKRPSPTILNSTPINCNQIKLSWLPTPDAQSYFIFDCTGNLITSTASTNYIASVAAGTTYGYKVQAFNTGWSNYKFSDLSNCISYNVPLNSAFLTATSTQLCPGTTSSLLNLVSCNTAITSIQWQSSVCSSAYADITGATGSSYLVTSAASTGTSFRAKLITGGTTYYSDVKVVAQYNVCNPNLSDIPGCGGGGGGAGRIGNFNTTSDENILSQTNIYPNPAIKELFIDLASNEDSYINISIYDVLGKIIYTKQNESGSLKNAIDISEFKRGIYYIKIENSLDSHFSKIIFE